MGHQGIAINDMCEEDKIEGLQGQVRLDSWWRITSTWMAIAPSSFFAVAHAANQVQAIIMALWEEYEDDYLYKCSISVDSLIENSGSEDLADDENAFYAWWCSYDASN